MELDISVENENPLFKRKEIEGIIKADVCPSKQEVIKVPADKYSAPEENIVVETIEGRFGKTEFVLVARIYESKEIKDKTEVKTKKQREEEKKAQEEAAKQGVESDVGGEAPAENSAGEGDKSTKESNENEGGKE